MEENTAYQKNGDQKILIENAVNKFGVLIEITSATAYQGK
jgi:hypothetical protein